MRIFELLAEGYPDTISAFNQAAAPELVKKTVDQYRALVNRNQVQGDERNIDWWKLQGWEKFARFVADKIQQPSPTQVKRGRAQGQSIILKETPKWLVVIPLDHDASCFHGRDSDWCTARPNSHYFDEYFLDREINLIYCINKESGLKYAIASHPSLSEMELFDQADKSMTAGQFQVATGFNPQQLVTLIPQNDSRIAQARQTRRDLLSRIQKRMKVWSQNPRQLPDLERELIEARNSDAAAYYIIVLGQHRNGQLKFPNALSMMAVRSDLEGPFFESLMDLDDDLELSTDDYPLNYIYEPSRAVQLASVRNSAFTIKAIRNPSLEVQMAAVVKNGWALTWITNPSLEVQMAAVRQDPRAIEFIKNPALEVQMAAVQGNGRAIRYITDPSAEVQMAAVQEELGAIKYIKNPSPEVTALARSKGLKI